MTEKEASARIAELEDLLLKEQRMVHMRIVESDRLKSTISRQDQKIAELTGKLEEITTKHTSVMEDFREVFERHGA